MKIPIQELKNIWINLLFEPGIKVTDVAHFFFQVLFAYNKLCVFRFWFIQIGDICVQNWGCVVAQFAETLRYKVEGRRFDSRWDHLDISLT